MREVQNRFKWNMKYRAKWKQIMLSIKILEHIENTSSLFPHTFDKCKFNLNNQMQRNIKSNKVQIPNEICKSTI